MDDDGKLKMNENYIQSISCYSGKINNIKYGATYMFDGFVYMQKH